MKTRHLPPLTFLFIGLASGTRAAIPPVPPAPTPPTPAPPSPVLTDRQMVDRHVSDYIYAKRGVDQSAALESLKKDGSIGIEAILARFRAEAVMPNPDREVMSRLSHALVKIGKPSLVPVVAIFRDPAEPEALRAEMARILGRLQGYRSVFALVEVLSESLSRNPSPLAARILEVLGDVGDPRPYPSIETALQHEDPSVRFAAATAMGKLADPAAFPVLLKTLEDSDLAVRAASNRALVRLSGKDLGYNADASEAQRKAAQEKWREWWLKNRDQLKPPPDPLQAELWKHADEALEWAVTGKPMPGLKKEVVFTGPRSAEADPILISTANLPNGVIPVVEGRRVSLRAPETLLPVPTEGYWRFDPPKVVENRAEWTLSRLVPGQTIRQATFTFTLQPEGWQVEEVAVSEGKEVVPLPPAASEKQIPPAPPAGPPMGKTTLPTGNGAKPSSPPAVKSSAPMLKTPASSGIKTTPTPPAKPSPGSKPAPAKDPKAKPKPPPKKAASITR
ncbi:MAG: HEAT repeat domain-containing protein [Armatimonadetes bacterium]|nr:HEAT repeat domain-containing protein [Armatimonadota bacterium]